MTDGEQPIKLTGKQRAFAEAYLGAAHFNGAEAARIAQYKDPPQAAYENKINQAVRAYIEARLDAMCMTTNEALAEVREVALASWKHFIQVDGFGNAKMDLGSKVKALELILKAHGALTEKHEITLDIAEQAKQLAAEYGLDADELTRLAELIATGKA